MAENNRIVEVCKSMRIRQIDLINLKISNKQTINDIWRNRVKPNYDFLKRFLSEFKNINARWLITGEGEKEYSLSVVNDVIVPYGNTNEILKLTNEILKLNEEIRLLNEERRKIANKCYQFDEEVRWYKNNCKCPDRPEAKKESKSANSA